LAFDTVVNVSRILAVARVLACAQVLWGSLSPKTLISATVNSTARTPFWLSDEYRRDRLRRLLGYAPHLRIASLAFLVLLAVSLWRWH
jgi:hypothetical protein